MTDDWILSAPSCLSLLLNAIGINLGITKDREDLKKSASTTEDIRNAALYTLYHLLNHVGAFPSASGARSISSLLSEEDILAKIAASEKIPNAKEFIRHFLLDEDTILSTIDVPLSAGGPSIVIIVRDKTGRYAWEGSLIYTPMSDPVPPKHVAQKAPTVTQPFVPPSSGK